MPIRKTDQLLQSLKLLLLPVELLLLRLDQFLLLLDFRLLLWQYIRLGFRNWSHAVRNLVQTIAAKLWIAPAVRVREAR